MVILSQLLTAVLQSLEIDLFVVQLLTDLECRLRTTFVECVKPPDVYPSPMLV